MQPRVRTTAGNAFRNRKQRSDGPQPWTKHNGGTAHAAMHEEGHIKAKQSRPRHVVASTTISPTSARTTGRGGERRAAPTPCPPPKPCPTLQQAPLPSFPPSPPLSCMLGRQGRDARGRAVRGPWRGCWRELVVCGCGCGCGHMGLGMGGHTRMDGLLTGADGEMMFASNFRCAAWRWPRQAPAAGDTSQ